MNNNRRRVSPPTNRDFLLRVDRGRRLGLLWSSPLHPGRDALNGGLLVLSLGAVGVDAVDGERTLGHRCYGAPGLTFDWHLVKADCACAVKTPSIYLYRGADSAGGAEVSSGVRSRDGGLDSWLAVRRCWRETANKRTKNYESNIL